MRAWRRGEGQRSVPCSGGGWFGDGLEGRERGGVGVFAGTAGAKANHSPPADRGACGGRPELADRAAPPARGRNGRAGRRGDDAGCRPRPVPAGRRELVRGRGDGGGAKGVETGDG